MAADTEGYATAYEAGVSAVMVEAAEALRECEGQSAESMYLNLLDRVTRIERPEYAK